jgi:hypothetical protein
MLVGASLGQGSEMALDMGVLKPRAHSLPGTRDCCVASRRSSSSSSGGRAVADTGKLQQCP